MKKKKKKIKTESMEEQLDTSVIHDYPQLISNYIKSLNTSRSELGFEWGRVYQIGEESENPATLLAL